MNISLNVAHENKQCRIRPSVLCNKRELFDVTLKFFLMFFLMIGLVSKTTGVEISPIPKYNANLLRLQGTVALVLVTVLS